MQTRPGAGCLRVGAGAIHNRPELVVFIVDTDVAVRDSVASLVRSLGARALCFAHPEDCLKGFEAEEPGCLIAEINLPGMGGLELLRQVRDTGRSTPVIFLALRAEVEVAVRAMRSGAVDYIEKPFIDRQLADRIRELCGFASEPPDAPSQ